MGREINLLDRYPRSPRPIEARAEAVRPEQIAVARRFGPEFFDGDRLYGYGGYRYHERFWTDTVLRLRDHYRLGRGARVLDVGCAKGFMLFDFQRLVPGIEVLGLDISDYAIRNAKQEVQRFLTVGNAACLPYPSHSCDLVISINTVHNLPPRECKQALGEIERVSRGASFVTVDAWRNEEERSKMLMWNLTAQTYMHVDDWRQVFADAGYTGDYYWFIAE